MPQPTQRPNDGKAPALEACQHYRAEKRYTDSAFRDYLVRQFLTVNKALAAR